MRFIELFAGIGGFRYGLENCRDILQSKTTENIQDMPSTSERQTRFTCAWANEIDKYACQIYRKNYGEGELYEGDITKVNTEEIPDHDLLVGGFPCQAFSIAGKRGGFDDTRGTLFFEIARICRAKKPRLILLENVKGLLSHDSGKTFQTILKVLSDIGYILQWEVLNSKNFGVPQNRERVFIIGHIRGEPRPKVFPIRGSNEQNLKQIIGGGQGNRVYDTKGISTTIASQAGGQGAKTGLYAIGGLQKNAAKMKDQSPALTEAMGKGGGHTPIIVANTIDANYYKGINTNPGHASSNRGYFVNGKIRRLTPTECCRLQGFPDSWCNIGLDKDGKETIISDSQKYKCLGNAVTTNVVDEIGKRLIV